MVSRENQVLAWVDTTTGQCHCKVCTVKDEIYGLYDTHARCIILKCFGKERIARCASSMNGFDNTIHIPIVSITHCILNEMHGCAHDCEGCIITHVRRDAGL